MTTFTVPASTEEAEEQLGQLGRLITAREFERAALVWALTKPGPSGRKSPQSGISPRLSFSRFTQKGIHGLTSHRQVSRYYWAYQRAIDDGIADEFSLDGERIELPDSADWHRYFSPEAEPDSAEVVAAAIEADPFAVAKEARHAVKELKEVEDERNQALRDAYREEKISGLIDEHGWTRQRAEEFAETEKRPLIVEANRKAKRAEIRSAVRASKTSGRLSTLLSRRWPLTTS